MRASRRNSSRRWSMVSTLTQTSQRTMKTVKSMRPKKPGFLYQDLDIHDEIIKNTHPMPTGVYDWIFMIEPKSGKACFKSKKLGKARWGLPLADIHREINVSGTPFSPPSSYSFSSRWIWILPWMTGSAMLTQKI